MSNGCSKCGAETRYVSGISKRSGKPYAGYKCTGCDNMDFVHLKDQQAPKEAQKPIIPVIQASKLDYGTNNTRLECLDKAVKVIELFMAQKPSEGDTILGESTIRELVTNVAEQLEEWVLRKEMVKPMTSETWKPSSLENGEF